jgi:UDP-GlcNAc:undecaprenyl-phosphate/decaprenyl-phosphate GlcNAc-1-phosphate transferase
MICSMAMAILFLCAGFLIAVAAVPLIGRVAVRYQCLDEPGKRKIHKEATPRWGGITFALGMLPAYLYLLVKFYGEPVWWPIVAQLTASVLIVILGAVDDCRHLAWKTKLMGIVGVTTITIVGGGMVVADIGTYGRFGLINLGLLSVPFTYLCMIGVTNAVNLLYGLNGLAGGTALFAFLFLGLAAFFAGDTVLPLLALACVGSVGGFLIHNFPRARIFMGDAGSLFLGFTYANFAILMTQKGGYGVDPMFPVLVLILPIFDTLRVMLIRILAGRSPFSPDRGHLHHLMVRKGYSETGTVYRLVLITIVCGGLALMLQERQTSVPYLVVVLIVALVLSLFAESLGRRRIGPRGRKTGTSNGDT